MASIWPNLGTINTYLYLFWDPSVAYKTSLVSLNLPKPAWYAAKVYDRKLKGKIRYEYWQ